MMKIFRNVDSRLLDAQTIEEEDINSIDLMERAATALTDAICERWKVEMPVVVFAGPGNNGGDALAVARMLMLKGYSVKTYLFNTKNSLSDDCEANKNRLLEMEGAEFYEINTQFTPPELTENNLVVDGLFGSGLNKPLTGGFAAVVQYINSKPATVVSIDIPSGLMGEENTYNVRTNIIRANVTLSLQLPKLAFLFAENEEITGEWELLDIGLSKRAMEEIETPYCMVRREDIRGIIRPRGKFTHKGTYGHGLLIAGSRGMAGAAVMAAEACLRSGVGLLTVHTPFCNNVILQTAVPEAMVECDLNEYTFAMPCDEDEYQAIAMGPGLGRAEETELAVMEQVKNSQTPMVLDADALNILANRKQMLLNLPQESILTPHPKEMERLVGKCSDSYERLARAMELAKAGNVYILLKGAYSVVITPEGKCIFNTTGNPGMATAGSGDVLTGIILALKAQGYPSEEAAMIGMYVHGLAGDIAAKHVGQIALKARDIITYLPEAWKLVSE